MKRKPFTITLFYLLISWPLVVGLCDNGSSSEVVDHSIYGELLRKHVKNGFVNYQGFKNEEGKLDSYLKVLETADTKKLSRNEQFAFYINAYNAWTIKLILSDYPGVESIKDLGSILKSPWKKELCRIDGDVITLDHIEHRILRPRFEDPRVHFAVNCASKSCPPLISEPYLGNTLDQQLDDSVRGFINDAKHNRFEGDTLYASKIFKWFAEDFSGDIYGFFLKYAEKDLKRDLGAEKDSVKIKYLDYDWSLNGK